MLSRYAVAFLALAIGSASSALADPPAHGKWQSTFDEEFNGTSLDMNKWASDHGPTNPDENWRKRFMATRWPENAVVSGGQLHLVAKKEERVPGVPWTAGNVWPRGFHQQYGYFEARIRYAGAPGLNNAFWLDTDAKDGDKHYEIDINEGHYPNEVHVNYHDWSTGKDKQNPSALMQSANLSQDFHVYGLEWEPNELIWYVDGKEVARKAISAPVGVAPRMLLSTMVLTWAGPVTDDLNGKSMDIDWVHVYKRTDQ